MPSIAAKKQDLPPPGGYKPINYARIPAKQYFSGLALFGGYAVMTTVAAYVYYLTYKKVRKEEIEMKSSEFALMPMLVAERDREFLKQLSRNRDEEAKLMANVPGWVVGTYYGEPIFKTVPKDQLIPPIYHEYFAHTTQKAFNKRANLTLWT